MAVSNDFAVVLFGVASLTGTDTADVAVFGRSHHVPHAAGHITSHGAEQAPGRETLETSFVS